MTSSTPQTIAEAVSKFLSVRLSSKIAVQRSYDNWALKQIWEDRKRKQLLRVQRFDITAHNKLGSDLAVSRFVLGYCGGQIKNERGNWITSSSNLPKDYSKTFRVTAINASRSHLLTEGVDNFVGLEHLEFLDLSDNPKLDDFACDQLARQFRRSKTLKDINLSFNPLVSVYGLEILLKIPSLKRITAIKTQASDYEDIDLFTLAAEDERQCYVYVHENGQRFRTPELNIKSPRVSESNNLNQDNQNPDSDRSDR